MEGVSRRACDAIAKKINYRPWKRPGYKAPAELFLKILVYQGTIFGRAINHEENKMKFNLAKNAIYLLLLLTTRSYSSDVVEQQEISGGYYQGDLNFTEVSNKEYFDTGCNYFIVPLTEVCHSIQTPVFTERRCKLQYDFDNMHKAEVFDEQLRFNLDLSRMPVSLDVMYDKPVPYRLTYDEKSIAKPESYFSENTKYSSAPWLMESYFYIVNDCGCRD